MIRMIDDNLYLTKCNICGKNEKICFLEHHPIFQSAYICGDCWEEKAKQTMDMAIRCKGIAKLIREQEEKINEHI